MIKVKDRKLLLLPGDGIGPEVVREVRKIIEWFNKNKSLDFKIEEGDIAMTDGFYLENLSVDGQFNKAPGTAGSLNITKFETTMLSSFIKGNLGSYRVSYG